MPVDLSALTVADFEPFLGQTFTVALSDGQEYALQLIEVKDGGPAPAPQFRKPFSLLFGSPHLDAYLPQRTYELNHPQWGAGLLLFLVPLGPQQGLMQYQVVFG